ncbi:unnamed protein product [Caenorhabditis bovis]|uniref:Uncharacterized protein n=1 Tax=Caenorhabditis bovis TaxID=2654633 RepID=A0A8S1EAU3_9PELO|nr:unnamed protein product [Caenorhabditis bovis]
MEEYELLVENEYGVNVVIVCVLPETGSWLLVGEYLTDVVSGEVWKVGLLSVEVEVLIGLLLTVEVGDLLLVDKGTEDVPLLGSVVETEEVVELIGLLFVVEIAEALVVPLLGPVVETEEVVELIGLLFVVEIAEALVVPLLGPVVETEEVVELIGLLFVVEIAEALVVPLLGPVVETEEVVELIGLLFVVEIAEALVVPLLGPVVETEEVVELIGLLFVVEIAEALVVPLLGPVVETEEVVELIGLLFVVEIAEALVVPLLGPVVETEEVVELIGLLFVVEIAEALVVPLLGPVVETEEVVELIGLLFVVEIAEALVVPLLGPVVETEEVVELIGLLFVVEIAEALVVPLLGPVVETEEVVELIGLLFVVEIAEALVVPLLGPVVETEEVVELIGLLFVVEIAEALVVPLLGPVVETEEVVELIGLLFVVEIAEALVVPLLGPVVETEEVVELIGLLFVVEIAEALVVPLLGPVVETEEVVELIGLLFVVEIAEALVVPLLGPVVETEEVVELIGWLFVVEIALVVVIGELETDSVCGDVPLLGLLLAVGFVATVVDSLLREVLVGDAGCDEALVGLLLAVELEETVVVLIVSTLQSVVDDICDTYYKEFIYFKDNIPKSLVFIVDDFDYETLICEYSPDGKYFIIIGEEAHFCLYRSDPLDFLHERTVQNTLGWTKIRSISFSPSGSMFMLNGIKHNGNGEVSVFSINDETSEVHFVSRVESNPSDFQACWFDDKHILIGELHNFTFHSPLGSSITQIWLCSVERISSESILVPLVRFLNKSGHIVNPIVSNCVSPRFRRIIQMSELAKAEGKTLKEKVEELAYDADLDEGNIQGLKRILDQEQECYHCYLKHVLSDSEYGSSRTLKRFEKHEEQQQANDVDSIMSQFDYQDYHIDFGGQIDSLRMSADSKMLYVSVEMIDRNHDNEEIGIVHEIKSVDLEKMIFDPIGLRGKMKPMQRHYVSANCTLIASFTTTKTLLWSKGHRGPYILKTEIDGEVSCVALHPSQNTMIVTTGRKTLIYSA